MLPARRAPCRCSGPCGQQPFWRWRPPSGVRARSCIGRDDPQASPVVSAAEGSLAASVSPSPRRRFRTNPPIGLDAAISIDQRIRLQVRSRNHRSWETQNRVPRVAIQRILQRLSASASRWLVGSSRTRRLKPARVSLARQALAFASGHGADGPLRLVPGERESRACVALRPGSGADGLHACSSASTEFLDPHRRAPDCSSPQPPSHRGVRSPRQAGACRGSP